MSETPPQAYISKVHLKGYKSIKDLEIDFKPGLNIIIGPNGSGKTNFLEGLLNQALLPKFREKSFVAIDLVDSQKNIYSWSFQVDKVNYDVNFFESPTTGKGTINDNKGLVEHFDDVYSSYDALKKYLNNDFFRIFNPVKVGFKILSDVTLLEVPLNVEINFKKQSVNGSVWFPPLEGNFFSDFDFKKNNFNDFSESKFIQELEFKKGLIDNLQRYTPIKDLRIKQPFVFKKSEKDEKVFVDFVLFEFYVNNDWFTWNELSDGTKRIFIIITQTMGWRGLMLIEEPEIGIHPDQLHDLMDFLQAQSKTKQIIITTHSPEVLSILGNDELDRIVVTRYDAEKGTQMHHLSPKQIRKGQIYIEEVGNLSSFWVHSNLEEYEAEAQ